MNALARAADTVTDAAGHSGMKNDNFKDGEMRLTVGLALNQVGGEGLGSSILGGIALFSACAVTHAGISATAAAGRGASAPLCIAWHSR